MSNSLDDLSPVNEAPFDEVIEEMEKLMSQDNRVFLLGAGSSKCANLPLMTELTKNILERDSLKDSTKHLLEYLNRQYDGSNIVTIEDYMSDIVDIVALTSRRRSCGASKEDIDIEGQGYNVESLEEVLDDIKTVMVEFLEPSKIDISIHRDFVKNVHSLRVGKSSNWDQVDYFVLNYDTLIENALSLEKIPYTDGFDGGAVGWWDNRNYERRELSARVFKIHGSIDWLLLEGDTLPRRIRKEPFLDDLEEEIKERFMIWPAATKYRETQRDPYAQLVDYLRKSLNRSGSNEVILTICGYRFADSHVNIEIERALIESDQRLTVMIFTDMDKPCDWIQRWHQNKEIANQVRIHSKRGYHGENTYESQIDLPWWKFENLVRILGGQR